MHCLFTNDFLSKARFYLADRKVSDTTLCFFCTFYPFAQLPETPFSWALFRCPRSSVTHLCICVAFSVIPFRHAMGHWCSCRARIDRVAMGGLWSAWTESVLAS